MRYAVASIKAILGTLVNNFDLKMKVVDTTLSLDGGLMFRQGEKTKIEIKKRK